MTEAGISWSDKQCESFYGMERESMLTCSRRLPSIATSVGLRRVGVADIILGSDLS